MGDVKPAFGEWEKLATGKTLWNDSTPDGREIEAGLPNIKGTFDGNVDDGETGKAGVFYNTGAYFCGSNGTSGNGGLVGFDARKGETDTNGNVKTSGQVFGNSNTVQPPAIAVSMWKRTA